MADTPRSLMHLTSGDVPRLLTVDSVLCLPVGSTEQHGPHLPLNADSIIASQVASRIVARWGAQYHLWLLPMLEYGLSGEHAWAPGTVSLSTTQYAALLHAIVAGLVAAQPARNLLLINGHGGNRGVLEALLLEFRAQYQVAACVIHPSALSEVKSGSACCEVHGGKSETSVLLALAPHLVNLERLPPPVEDSDSTQVRNKILNRGVSWPWYSNDPGLGIDGVIGDAATASAELGSRIVDGCVKNAEWVIQALAAYGKEIRSSTDGRRK